MASEKPAESFAALFEQTRSSAPRARGPRVGDTVDALVVQVGKDAVFVELDGHRQAYLDTVDLLGPDGVVRVAVGDRLKARVAGTTDDGTRLTPTVEAAVAAGATVALGEDQGPAAVKVAVGQIVSGAVERVESYGLFLQLEGTRGRAGRGLLPVSELGTPRGADLRKLFPLGTKVRAKIVGLEEGKMRLSVRALKDDEERAEFTGFRDKEKKTEAPQGFGTLGDLLKKRGR